MSIRFIDTDFEKANYLLNLLVSRATGSAADSGEYEVLRQELLSKPSIAEKMPSWVRVHRNLDSFWGFIKQKYASYAERRTFLSEEFTPLLDAIEFGDSNQMRNSAASTHEVKRSPTARNKRKVFIPSYSPVD